MKVFDFNILSLFILAALMGCQPVSEPLDAVVTVSGISLTWSEVHEVVPDHLSVEDSVTRANSYIQNWIKDQVILSHAEKNLTEAQMNFDEEMEAYKRSLLMYAFENQVVRQKLDTAISDSELQAYHEDNLDNFQLKDYIVKAKFCILDSTTVITDEFVALFNSDDPADIVAFEQFCVDNGASYFIDDEKWFYLGELLEEVPAQIYQPESFLKKNKSIQFQRDKRIYFLKILDYKLKDSVSPLSLQREKIRNTILNSRKISLLSEMREDLYQEALRKNQIDINYE